MIIEIIYLKDYKNNKAGDVVSRNETEAHTMINQGIVKLYNYYEDEGLFDYNDKMMRPKKRRVKWV